ncbi:hypothetical protein L915_10124 [Phytophthora nicotianae]|uniref:Uncharacterized protein n=2 Tax=Phytophthora nicotianae TaxID=4792 RepID=W2RAT7_PHYN3|nr:hypothetical protein PPTG_21110 [Phytophthora nicotianae INRA-310]ETK84958.1 hypothetical protein L915_10124 [Phytophthora nicotianae]ETN21665.1 hypothetical protein PPTG_21110 [Phytophthora nicotianae INRA-310]
MVSSRSITFKLHPAIIAALFNTILVYTVYRRRAWYTDGSVNLSKFTVSVAMPNVREPQSLDDILNVLTVPHVFGERFMDHHTCQPIACAREFADELRSFGQ